MFTITIFVLSYLSLCRFQVQMTIIIIIIKLYISNTECILDRKHKMNTTLVCAHCGRRKKGVWSLSMRS